MLNLYLLSRLGANNKMLESPLGLGLIDNAKSTVDAINRTHDELFGTLDLVKDAW